MKSLYISLLLIFVQCGCFAERLTLDVPQATWEQIYFEAINERARLSNLKNLRETVLPKDDLEVRVWEGFGLTALRGFIIKRTSSQWSASYLPGIRDGMSQDEFQFEMSPKSDWQVFWKRLTDEGLLTLPDVGLGGCNEPYPDATGVVVEVKQGSKYRTYNYISPEISECEGAKQMSNIVSMLHKELQLKNKR